MMNVVAVIVTNNRLALLQEAIAAIKAQSYPLNKVIVVDNASTDGTAAWLDSQPGLEVIHQENLGGSGGFFTGIKDAVKEDPDWIWVMDDDTIPNPNTLSQLIEDAAKIPEDIGFIGSKCIWLDGTPHLMNLPAIGPSFNKTIPFNRYDDKGMLLIETCSFVSLLISCKAVTKVGLPYKEFFIWGDDQEYTRRITKAGFLGCYSINSIALHKTGINYFPDFYRDISANLWKHAYGFRNEFFMIKKNKGLAYFLIWLLLKLVFTSAKLIAIRKQDRFKFVSVLIGAGWHSIFFNPKIVYAE